LICFIFIDFAYSKQFSASLFDNFISHVLYLMSPFYPPIITVKHPSTMVPPCAVESPILAAGFPPIITEADPMAIVSGGPVHTH
jgi:hypothetical protein